MERITEDSIIQAILDASKAQIDDSNPHGAVTCLELARQMGHSRGWVMERLHKLIGESVVGVTELQRIKIGNMRYRTPAYYVKKTQKGL